ncbi:MAG: hypothetical protein ACOYOB_18730 [Myxococcota bacterium]
MATDLELNENTLKVVGEETILLESKSLEANQALFTVTNDNPMFRLPNRGFVDLDKATLTDLVLLPNGPGNRVELHVIDEMARLRREHWAMRELIVTVLMPGLEALTGRVAALEQADKAGSP